MRKLVDVLDEEKLRPQLSSAYIERELQFLRRQHNTNPPVSALPATDTAPDEAPAEIRARVGALMIQQAETVNVYVTIVNGGNGTELPLPTGQST